MIRRLPIRKKQPRKKQPKMLVHYPAVVEYVYNNRFATVSQIRRYFATYMTNKRTAQYQLSNLVQLGYLQTTTVRSTSPNFPFVFFATARGVRLIAEAYTKLDLSWNESATEASRAKGMALTSVLHELLITEFDLAVWQTIEQRPDLERLIVERRYFQKDKQLSFEHRGRPGRVIPDSGFLLRTAGQALQLNFTELDNGTMSLPRLLAKYQQYERWASSSESEEYLSKLYHNNGYQPRQPNFRLLMVIRANFTKAGDDQRLLDLFMQTLELSPAMRDRIWLTTVDNLRAQQDKPSPLSAPIWLRARNAKKWLKDYQTCSNELPRGRGQKPYKKQREFVAQRLPDMPRHSLFPVETSPAA